MYIFFTSFLWNLEQNDNFQKRLITPQRGWWYLSKMWSDSQKHRLKSQRSRPSGWVSARLPSLGWQSPKMGEEVKKNMRLNFDSGLDDAQLMHTVWIIQMSLHSQETSQSGLTDSSYNISHCRMTPGDVVYQVSVREDEAVITDTGFYLKLWIAFVFLYHFFIILFFKIDLRCVFDWYNSYRLKEIFQDRQTFCISLNYLIFSWAVQLWGKL